MPSFGKGEGKKRRERRREGRGQITELDKEGGGEWYCEKRKKREKGSFEHKEL